VALNELINAAAHTIARELDAQLVEVLELTRPDKTVRRLASAGLHLSGPWDSDVDCPSAWADSEELGAGQTVLVPDWQHEVRIAARPELAVLGVASSAAVPLCRADNEPACGLLWVHALEHRIFSDDELAFVETVAAVLSQAAARARVQEDFRTVVENSPDVIARFDGDLRHTYVNLAMERVTGLSAASLIGYTSREAGMPESVLPSWELLLRQAWRTGREQTAEFGMPTPFGERQFLVRVTPEPGPRGVVQSLLAMARDVTDQRHAELERTDFYREVVEQRNQLTDLMSRLQTDHARDLQRAKRALEAAQLTSRDRDVLRLIARGWTNRRIAAELQLSPGTIKNHVAHILATLNASDRTQAAVWAVELGLEPSR
jgi:PAS domain S-box-containing protein